MPSPSRGRLGWGPDRGDHDKRPTRARAAFLLAALALAVASTVSAHHQLGLPHYLYNEEYPQIPTMVIDAEAEGYDVTFSIYPGNPQPGDIVRVSAYIKHAMTGAVYQKPVEMSVSTVKFLRGENFVDQPKPVASEYNEYKVSYRFETAEKYLVNLKFEPRPGFFETIPFPVVIGKTKFSVVPIVAAVIFVGTFVAVGLTKKRGHGRRTRPKPQGAAA
ncbi:hypothetical protein HOK31_17020 [Candidatus Poribacteria bacterium]|nr:hypothetical protein [Candidatus Poribacteria bacterium]